MLLCLVAQAASDSLWPPMGCNLPHSSIHGNSSGNIGWAAPQGSSPIQGSNPGLRFSEWILYHVTHQASPKLSLDKTKSVSKQNQSPCWVSHRGLLSSIFLNTGTTSQPTVNGQIVNRSDVLSRSPHYRGFLLCLLELRWCLASSQGSVSPEPMRQGGHGVPQCWKGGVDSQRKVFTDEKDRKKICQLKESTVLLVEIHTVIS